MGTDRCENHEPTKNDSPTPWGNKYQCHSCLGAQSARKGNTVSMGSGLCVCNTGYSSQAQANCDSAGFAGACSCANVNNCDENNIGTFCAQATDRCEDSVGGFTCEFCGADATRLTSDVSLCRCNSGFSSYNGDCIHATGSGKSAPCTGGAACFNIDECSAGANIATYC